jgi:hypothetical protein
MVWDLMSKDKDSSTLGDSNYNATLFNVGHMDGLVGGTKQP